MAPKLKLKIICSILFISIFIIQSSVVDSLEIEKGTTQGKNCDIINDKLLFPDYINYSDLIDPLFTLQAVINENSEEKMEYMYQLQEDLEAIGIALDVEVIDWPSFVDKIIFKRDFDISAMTLLNSYTNPDYRGIYSEDCTLNFSNYNSTMDYNATLGTGMNEWYLQQGKLIMAPDSTERVAHIWEWQNYMMEKILSVIPMHVSNDYETTWSELYGYDITKGLMQSWGNMTWTGTHLGQNSTSEVVIPSESWTKLNPLFNDDPSSQLIYDACMDPLVKYDDAGEAFPHIISDWTHINDTHIRLSIREGIKWQNDSGNLFTNEYVDADDVFFSIYSYHLLSNRTQPWMYLEDVEIVDDYTVDIFLDADVGTPENEPWDVYIDSLTETSLLPEHYLNQTQIGDGITPDIHHSSWSTFNTNCFGTGLLELDSYIPNINTNMTVFNDCWWLNSSITMGPSLDWENRFGDFTGGLDKLRISVVLGDSARIANFTLGSLDIIDITGNDTIRRNFETDSTYSVQSDVSNSLRNFYFSLNETRGTPLQSRDLCPFNSSLTIGLAVRRAISHAVDREDINNVVNNGEYVYSDYPIALKYEKWLNPNIIRYDYNVDKAKEYLMYAGYETGLDSDGDGLTDIQELNITHTDRLDPDTDGDGLDDYEEVTLGVDGYYTDPNDADSDNDGLDDGDEYTEGTDPNDTDSDDDGLDDREEIILGEDGYYTDPNDADSDDDGLNDSDEIVENCNPNNDDSDNDGLLDGAEVHTYHTNPNLADTDEDGLNDGVEVTTYFTNPNQEDTDGDSLSDYDEIFGSYYPNNPAADEDGLVRTNPLLVDSDSDGYNDKVELEANTDPNDSEDHPFELPFWFWWAIGGATSVIAVIVIVSTIVVVSKKKRSPSTYVAPTLKSRDVELEPELTDEEKQAEQDRLDALIRAEESRILSEIPDSPSDAKAMDAPSVIPDAIPVDSKDEFASDIFADTQAKNKITIEFLTNLLKLKSLIIMEKNGIPLVSMNFTQNIDSTLASGFLTAITSFSQELMQEDQQQSKSKFSQMGQEGGIFWVFEGSFVRFALLLESEPTKDMKRPIWDFIKQFETDFLREIKDFTGELTAFDSSRDLLEEHLFVHYLYPLKLNGEKIVENNLLNKDVVKVLERYFENFDDDATLDIHQLIERFFREIRTLDYNEILEEIISCIEAQILIPEPITLQDS